MELLQLQYFRTVARLEHMTKASRELRIAQPALSKTISRLEEDIGVPLFDRNKGKIRLNLYGKAFLNKAEQALRLLEEGKREVADLAGLEKGGIHLATSNLDRMAGAMNEFLALHPEVNLRISHVSPAQSAHHIASGEADLSFSPLPVEQTDCAQVPVLSEDLYLAVPLGHPFAGRSRISLKEAAREPFIGYREDFIFQQMNDDILKQAGAVPRYICRVDEPPAILSLVRAGIGVALFGCKRGENADSDLVLVPVEDPGCRRQYYLAWHEQRYLSAAAREFRDFVVQYFAKN
ncbi:LysR family transcriptional regulator [Paenibacillus sp. FSL W8-0194]|uniref:LysR family transcriptional regulator n=1 Tax=Paenibacillus sp. FSL W8-0194 TaxID=2921711 RepID=UPI0030DD7877